MKFFEALSSMPDIPMVENVACFPPASLTSESADLICEVCVCEALIIPCWGSCRHLSCRIVIPAFAIPSSPMCPKQPFQMASDASLSLTGCLDRISKTMYRFFSRRLGRKDLIFVAIYYWYYEKI